MRSKWWAIGFWFAASMLLLAVHHLYIIRTWPDSIYMDSLRLLHQLSDVASGERTVFDLWAAGGHHGLITQLFLAANVHLFGLNAVLANMLTGPVILAVGILFLFGYSVDWTRTEGQSSGLHYVTTGLLLLGISLSFVGFELLTLDMGLPIWVKNLVFVCYWFAHSSFLDRPTGIKSFVLSLVAVPVVLAVGMGWSYAFTATIVGVTALDAVLQRDVRLAKIAPALAVIAAQFAYLLLGGGHDEQTAVGAGSAIYKVATLPFYGLGSTLIGSEWVSRVWGGADLVLLAGVVVFAAGLLGFVAFVRNPTVGRRAIYLMLYGGLCAVAFAIARGDQGFHAMLASRYYMDLVLFPLGAIWLLSLAAKKSLKFRYFKVAGVIVFGVVFIAAHLVQGAAEYRNVAPYRAASFRSMNERLVEMQIDQTTAQLMQAPLSDLQRAAAIMRIEKLGVFRGTTGSLCDQPFKLRDGWYPPESGGAWMASDASIAIAGCGCSATLVAYLPQSFPERKLTISSGTTTLGEFNLQSGARRTIAINDTRAPTPIRISVSRVTVPQRDLSGSGDVRELGVLVSVNELTCTRKSGAARRP